ncbi:MAG TPA: helix-turn-helix domain-containing protein [Puia sp.]|nr:helix-turn-helix domain-containing protein [Puia sp.]
MKISSTDILFILIIFQLLFLSLFLLTRKNGKPVSNILLGSFFLAICINLLDVFLLQQGFYSSNPQFAGLGSCLPLLFGPLIYFYTKSVVYKNFSPSSKNIYHFLPFLILFAGTEYYFLGISHSEQENILAGFQSHHFPFLISIISTLIFLQFLFYTLASLSLVSAYKKASGQYFSDSRNMNVSWLYNTFIFFIAIIIISALNGIIAQTHWVKYYLTVFNIIVLFMLLYVIRVMMKALHKPDFFTIPDEGEIPDQSQGSPHKSSSKPDNFESDRIAQMVLAYVKEKKPYLNPELTLDQLASQVSLRPRVLSQVINEELGQNFYDFINRNRIEEASMLLNNPKDRKITVLEVLYKVGFNSKSSFNTLFKKYTGLTPSEFKKKNLR